MRGVLPAIDLPKARAGRRVRTAGMVITRQDGVTSIKAERVSKLDGLSEHAAYDSHDFH